MTTRVAVGAVRLSDGAHACRTAPSPAPVFGVTSQLGKICNDRSKHLHVVTNIEVVTAKM